MKKIFSFTALLLSTILGSAQLAPEVTSWVINTNGSVGYDSIPSNVLMVQYSSNWVYVSCNSIPDYSIGPWPANPNTPEAQGFLFRITRNPQENTGVPDSTVLGHIGIWKNGVSIYNAKDGRTFPLSNLWHYNAVMTEDTSFDSCLGHPDAQGEYHLHLTPKCIFDETDSLNHSPLIGFAFDGFPVYGSYGFADTNGTGGITRMRSSYQLRNITVRHTLPDGTILPSGLWGPPLTAFDPLGKFIEDFEYIPGLGDLDDHNGRFCVTPEYPLGTYAYFLTVDYLLQPEYPYTIGPTYYGILDSGNTGPGSGHDSITEPVTVYVPSGISEFSYEQGFLVYPNPTQNIINIKSNSQSQITSIMLLNGLGEIVNEVKNVQSSEVVSINISDYSSGIYFLKIATQNTYEIIRVVKLR